MPSLVRPNAPRLPSEDFDDLFYKPRTLRNLDTRDSVGTPSPLSTPANTVPSRRGLHSSEGVKPLQQSPLATPTPGTTQRRPLLVRQSALWFQSSETLDASREPPKKSTYVPLWIEELTPAKYRVATSHSIVKERTRNVSSDPNLRESSRPKAEDQAPQEARAGFRWSHDFLGGWLEIKIGKGKESDGKEKEEQPCLDLERLNIPSSTTSSVRHPRSNTTTVTDSTGHVSGQPIVPEDLKSLDPANNPGRFKEGLYCRTKRALGLKHGRMKPYLAPKIRTPTGAMLDRVVSTLRFVPIRASTGSTSSNSSLTNLSIAAPTRRRDRPGHQSGWSASSSVRDLRLGKSLPGTPEPEQMYTASDSKQFLSVELTQPDAPAFLPSEARRVNTPPLSSAGSGKGHSRGFFFEYVAPSEGNQDTLPRRPPPPEHAIKTSKTSRSEDWYRVKMESIETGPAASKDDSPPSIPEHFPNSPLCPRNPKHKSGGTGTCPYHGRNKSTPSDMETPPVGKPGTLSPVRENETWWLK